jgi:hypothetical protein
MCSFHILPCKCIFKIQILHQYSHSERERARESEKEKERKEGGREGVRKRENISTNSSSIFAFQVDSPATFYVVPVSELQRTSFSRNMI